MDIELKNTDYYRRLVDFVLTAGTVLMTSGAETHRVEDTITRILQTTGFVHADAFVLTTGITVTLSDLGENTFSVTRRINPGSTDMTKISAINSLSREFCDGKILLRDAQKRLESIVAAKTYGKLVKCVATAVATACFAFIFGGTYLDSAASAICGFVAALVLYYVSMYIRRNFITVVITAASVTLCALGLREAAALCDITLQCPYIIVGAIMPVVPGVAITNGIRDILYGDYLASGSRIIEAFMIAAAVALGVGFGIFVGGRLGMTLETLEFAAAGEKEIFRIIEEILLSFVAIAGFCLIFDIPKENIFLSSLLAAVCWTVYIICEQEGMSVVWASFFPTTVVYCLSFIFAKLRRAPVTLFLIGGILPLVPGTYIYKTAFYMITSQGDTARTLTLTILVAGAIALGMFVMDTLIVIVRGIIKK